MHELDARGSEVAEASVVKDPELSLVMPCYDEEEVVERTVLDLLAAFDAAGRRLELIAVDNGSRDATGAILAALGRGDPRLVVTRVEVNRGYGNGILAGLVLARAPWVAITCADAQVGADDVVKLFGRVRPAEGPRILKVRRRFRQDGLRRKIVSVSYNAIMTVLFPGIGSIDVNGNPKILPRETLERMGLVSRDWFLDAEILIKARSLRVPVLEVDVVAHARSGGTSNVRASTCFEFAKNLFDYRFRRRGRIEMTGADCAAGADRTRTILREGAAPRR